VFLSVFDSRCLGEALPILCGFCALRGGTTFTISGDLKGSTGSLPDLVQLVLEGVYLALDFLIERALRRDEQTAILSTGIAQERRSDGCRGVWAAGSSSKAPKTCIDASPYGLLGRLYPANS
jgi:hypothetical protein